MGVADKPGGYRHIQRLLFAVHGYLHDRVGSREHPSRQPGHLIAKNVRYPLRRGEVREGNAAGRLLDRNHRRAGCAQAADDVVDIIRRLVRHHLLRTEGGLGDLWLRSPEAVDRPRRIPGEVDAGNPRAVGGAKDAPNVVGAANIVKNEFVLHRARLAQSTMPTLIPLQFLALLAYTILRIVLALVLLSYASRQFADRRALTPVLALPFWPFGRFSLVVLIATELLIAGLFLLGFLTQLAAILLILLLVKLRLFYGSREHPALPSGRETALMLGISLSLFITGAGAFAIDLPI